MAFEGGCLCGRVRYRAEVEPSPSVVCHCRSCQRATSAPVVGWVTVPRSALVWTTEAPATYASSPGVTRSFCATCGSPLTWGADHIAETIDITTVSLDEPDRFPPTREVWTSHARSWTAGARPQYPRSAGEGM